MASAKRPRDDEEEEKKEAYPFMVAADADYGDVYTLVNDATARFLSDAGSVSLEELSRWPYFFALPPHESSLPSPREAAVPGRAMPTPRSQQLFMEGVAPDNRALIQLWKHAFATVFALRDRATENDLLREWANHAYVHMRSVLREHPLAGQLTDLVSMIPLVAKGVAGDDEPHWRLYERFFMPGPDRVGVALPVGLVLFEGCTSEPTQLLEQRVRRAPFSTSWHVNVGIGFASGPVDSGGSLSASRSRHACLFVHKVMSDGIVGVDVQHAQEEDNTRPGQRRRLSTWLECEIVVQPLVSVHLVHEAVIAIQRRTGSHLQVASVIAQRVFFTHAFLGDTCPCEARAAAESSKQQRTHGRLNMIH